ncbi:permease-like cell division protein FtsX [Balneatrix alpica]|uniref:Cell division protein FtsX n=1 Tax=Balneatrix alpica TaxID=75684 RepID=A0ABV5ZFH5_9GAMM|nr:permease-like cell division protein FtsX [Balneatrix alpica]
MRRAERQTAGAVSHQVSRGDVLRAWWRHHRQEAATSLAKLLRQPLGSLMTLLVIAIALALPGLLYVVLSNVSQLSGELGQSTRMSVYLADDASQGQGESLAYELSRDPAWQEVRYVSKEQALREFQQLSGLADVLAGLESNPLPAVIVLKPAGQIHPQEASRLLQELEALPEVEVAQLDMEWVQRLHTLLDIARRVVVALSGLFGIAVLLVVGNTIRLSIESRRDEIVVIKLVGGTDAYVRRPFLYTGLWYGLLGGLLAWLLIALCLHWLGDPVSALGQLYQTEFELRGLGWQASLWLLGGAAVLGVLGAGLAVGRHLSAIQPR